MSCYHTFKRVGQALSEGHCPVCLARENELLTRRIQSLEENIEFIANILTLVLRDAPTEEA